MTLRLAHRVAGDPAAPPMLLLHGLGHDSQTWDAVLPALARTHRVYALDLRGHGDSPHPGEYSFELMRDDVLGFLGTMGIDRCVLIGHSLGGTVGVLVARAAPHRLTHLVLGDIVPPPPGALDRPPLPVPAEPTPYDWAAINAIRAQLTDPDPAWTADLVSVAVPTLIVGGATSHFPQHLLAEAAAAMPDARLVTLDCGHHVHRDRPEEFLLAVTAFLSGA